MWFEDVMKVRIEEGGDVMKVREEEVGSEEEVVMRVRDGASPTYDVSDDHNKHK